MTFGKSRLELKVGLFVLIGLVILFVFVLLIGDIKNIFSTYRIKFIFNFVNGVKIGAPIRLSGVDIGEVKMMDFLYSAEEEKNKVEVVGMIRKGIRIPADSAVWINTLGLLGEKYLDVMPGKDYKNLVREGQTMVGNDPFAMHEFGELAKSIAKKLDESILEVQNLATSVNSLTKNVDDGITKVKNAEGTIGKLLYDDTLYNDLSALISDIRKNPWKLFWKPKDKPVPLKESQKK